MGKYQLDYKGMQAVSKYHEKLKPAKFDKKQQLEKIRTAYLEKKQKQTDKSSEWKKIICEHAVFKLFLTLCISIVGILSVWVLREIKDESPDL